jgi:hypothetical protein
VNWKALVVACGVGIGIAGAPCAFGDEATPPAQPAASQKAPPPAAPETAAQPPISDTDKFLNEIKHPLEWFTWGGDFRVRQEYFKNAHGLLNNTDDQVNVFRFRERLWADFGSFFSDPTLGIPNGLDIYIRMADETRYYLTRPTNLPWSVEPPYGTNPSFNEIIVDNLYVNWDRPAGVPVSFKIGRQDLTYGRGFVMMDGTPLDGSRSLYSDAIKLTLHADPIKTDLDLFAVDNKADESRLQPIAIEAGQEEFTSDYDTKMLGAYLTSKYFANTEINVYYIYKDDTFADYGVIKQIFYGSDAMSRIVHTVGGLVQGTVGKDKALDYYVEPGFQWGNEGGIPNPSGSGAPVTNEENRIGYAVNSDLGYTFKAVDMTPLVHAAYEYLSGNDPHSKTFGGWDPVMARWPQISELYVYRWEGEGGGVTGVGSPGDWTNLQAFTLGASAKPTPKMTTSFDYSLLLANEHTDGVNLVLVNPTVGYGHGYVRGSLFVAKLLYNFNAHISGHLWAEYFIPGDFYASNASNAIFLRWEMTFKL